MSEVTKKLKKKTTPVEKKSDIKKEKNNEITKNEKVLTDQEKVKDSSKSEDSSLAPNKKKKYVRGENQKPVTKAYRNNWNQIFSTNNKK